MSDPPAMHPIAVLPVSVVTAMLVAKHGSSSLVLVLVLAGAFPVRYEGGMRRSVARDVRTMMLQESAPLNCISAIRASSFLRCFPTPRLTRYCNPKHAAKTPTPAHIDIHGFIESLSWFSVFF